MPPERSAGTDPEAELPRFAGQYQLEAQLGSGGMGIVHLARSASGLRLAVKVVHAGFAQDPEFRGRFRQEVEAARRVSGAFTAPVVDADPEAEHPWMATLFIPGPTLAEHVKRNGALPPASPRRCVTFTGPVSCTVISNPATSFWRTTVRRSSTSEFRGLPTVNCGQRQAN
jgi:serine/threonine protein kinase